ncbi:MAG: T9SS type A sorting domain-containing protein [Bacteroidia bacterium]|nr:T9SS type A sorting domain-containing protein [Bacteroidia bacterium]
MNLVNISNYRNPFGQRKLVRHYICESYLTWFKGFNSVVLGIIGVFVLLCVPGQSQTISAVSFPASKQLGIADTIRINVTVGTPNSGAFFDSYNISYDTITINLKHCISYLTFYGTATIPTKIPPQPAGKYKIRINLKTYNATLNPNCSIEYKRNVWNDSIDVSSLYTSVFSKIENEEAFRIYPSPVEGKLLISEKNISGYKKIVIQNSMGQYVYEDIDTSAEIDISSIGPGVYYLSILIEGGQSYRFKFIKQ